jgi:hypothetical protein
MARRWFDSVPEGEQGGKQTLNVHAASQGTRLRE